MQNSEGIENYEPSISTKTENGHAIKNSLSKE